MDKANIVNSYDIGQRMLYEGNWRRAIPHFERAIQEDPQDYRAYNDLGYIYADKLGNVKKGLEYSKQAAQYAPDGSFEYAAILDTIGWCYYLLGEIIQAKDYLEKAVCQADDSDDYQLLRLYHLLLVHISTKDVENAKNIYERIEHRRPESTLAIEAQQKSKEAMRDLLDQGKWSQKFRRVSESLIRKVDRIFIPVVIFVLFWGFLSRTLEIKYAQYGTLNLVWTLGSLLILLAYMLVGGIVTPRPLLSTLQATILPSFFVIGYYLKSPFDNAHYVVLGIGVLYGTFALLLNWITKTVKRKRGTLQVRTLDAQGKPIWMILIGISYFGAAIIMLIEEPYIVSYLAVLAGKTGVGGPIPRILGYLPITLSIAIGAGLIKRQRWAWGIGIFAFPCWFILSLLEGYFSRVIAPLFFPPIYLISLSLGKLPYQSTWIWVLYALHLYCHIEPKALASFRRRRPKPPEESETEKKTQDKELAEEHFLIGQKIARGEKDWQGSLTHFEEAIRLDPSDYRSYEEAAYWLVDKLDDPQKGLKYAMKAMGLVSDDPSSCYVAVLDTLGWCYCKLGRIEEAKECLEKAIKFEDPLNDFFILRVYHLLVVYELMENIQGAKEIYARIESKPFPEEDWIVAEAKQKAQEVFKRVLQLERQKERQKIKEFAKTWEPLCHLENKRAPSNEIAGAIKLLEIDRNKAKSKLERLVSAFPLDPIVVHCLAVMHYWDIAAGKVNGKVYANIIGYWVRLMCFDEFWHEWKREREQFYFEEKIEQGKIDDLHRFLWEMLEEKIPDVYKGYLIREKKTVERIRNLNEWQEVIGLDGPVRLLCGPLMLKKLRMDGKFREMAVMGMSQFPSHDDFVDLMLYLSPFGLATVFLEEERLADVFSALDKTKDMEVPQEFRTRFVNTIDQMVVQKTTSSEKIEILREALEKIKDETLEWILCREYKERANEFARVGDWDQAGNSLELAFAIDSKDKDTEEKLFTCYLNSSHGKLQANKVEEATLVIEKAEKVRLSDDRKENLANLCFGCAIKFFEKDKPEKAEMMAVKAKKHGLKNEQVDQLLQVLKPLKRFGKEVLDLLGKARKSMSSKRWDTAITNYRTGLREAKYRLSTDAIREIEHELAVALNAKAVERANRNPESVSILEESLSQLEEARRLDPENEMIRNNLEAIRSKISMLRDFSYSDRATVQRSIRDGHLDVEALERLMRELRLLLNS